MGRSEERRQRYDGYIDDVRPAAAAVGRREPYHLEYIRRHGGGAPAVCGKREGGGTDGGGGM